MPVIALVALAVALADLRFAILALMLLLVLFPMVATFLWFSTMLAPETARAILPKRVTITSGIEIVITYTETGQSDTIPWSRVLSVRRRGSNYIVTIRSGNPRVIVIPTEAIIK